jgi:hypothetical protein
MPPQLQTGLEELDRREDEEVGPFVIGLAP